jgi:hypothetical protein
VNGVHVFLGPSLPVEEARTILDAEYLPPVKMGDVQALVRARPRVVCIVDGYFERVPAVWHKEILCALTQGIRVVGASSMGALRAAELCSFGMEGVGTVFEAFRDGGLTADDEVALVHGDAADGYRALSEPLVNIRDGLSLAEARGLVSLTEREALVEAARATFYPERSWPRVVRDAQAFGMDAERIERLRSFLAEERPNVKRRDAVAALTYVATTLDRPASDASFDFEPTEFWLRLVATTSRAPADAGGIGPTAASVVDHARIAIDDYRALRDRALLSLLASSEAERAGILVGAEQITAAARRFRFRQGLLSAEGTRQWLARNSLTAEDLTELCRLEAICDELCARHGRELDEAIAIELKRTGRFASYADAVRRRDDALRAAGIASPSLEDAGVDTRALLDWYKEHFRPLSGGIDLHAKDRGFRDTATFLREVVRIRCAGSSPAGRD